MITEKQAIDIAKRYGLQNEIIHCIHELNMDPEAALYEWDLLDLNNNSEIDESGAAQYFEAEFV